MTNELNRFWRRVSNVRANQSLDKWSEETFSNGVDNEEPEKARRGWKEIRASKNKAVILWETTSGAVYIERFYENGANRLTRIITEKEKREIENNWPKSET